MIPELSQKLTYCDEFRLTDLYVVLIFASFILQTLIRCAYKKSVPAASVRLNGIFVQAGQDGQVFNLWTIFAVFATWSPTLIPLRSFAFHFALLRVLREAPLKKPGRMCFNGKPDKLRVLSWGEFNPESLHTFFAPQHSRGPKRTVEVNPALVSPAARDEALKSYHVKGVGPWQLDGKVLRAGLSQDQAKHIVARLQRSHFAYFSSVFALCCRKSTRAIIQRHLSVPGASPDGPDDDERRLRHLPSSLESFVLADELLSQSDSQDEATPGTPQKPPPDTTPRAS